MRKRRELRQLTMDGGYEVEAVRELQTTWGGKRPGAGRPKTAADSVTISVRVPTELRSLLQARAMAAHQTLSDYLLQMIRECELSD